ARRRVARRRTEARGELRLPADVEKLSVERLALGLGMLAGHVGGEGERAPVLARLHVGGHLGDPRLEHVLRERRLLEEEHPLQQRGADPEATDWWRLRRGRWSNRAAR